MTARSVATVAARLRPAKCKRSLCAPLGKRAVPPAPANEGGCRSGSNACSVPARTLLCSAAKNPGEWPAEKKNEFDNRLLSIYIVVLLIVTCQRLPTPVEGIYVRHSKTSLLVIVELVLMRVVDNKPCSVVSHWAPHW